VTVCYGFLSFFAAVADAAAGATTVADAAAERTASGRGL